MDYTIISNLGVECILCGFVVGMIPIAIGTVVQSILTIIKKA